MALRALDAERASMPQGDIAVASEVQSQVLALETAIRLALAQCQLIRMKVEGTAVN